MLDQRDLERMEEAATRAATKMVDERAPGIVKTVVRESEARRDKKLEVLETSLVQKIETTVRESEARQDKKLKALETSLTQKIETTVRESEARQDKKLEALETSLTQKIETTVRESEARQDKKLETLETSLTEKMDVMREYLLGEIEKSQDLVLKEIAVTQNYIERNMDKKIDKIIQRLDKMEQFYRCDKLDSETLSLVVKNIDQLSRRIDAG